MRVRHLPIRLQPAAWYQRAAGDWEAAVAGQRNKEVHVGLSALQG